MTDYQRNVYFVFSINFEGQDDEIFATASIVAVEFLNSLLMESSENGDSEGDFYKLLCGDFENFVRQIVDLKEETVRAL